MVRNVLISLLMLVVVGPALLTLSSCCKDCDIQHQSNELDYLVYNQSTVLTFESNLGNQATYRFERESISENGQSCGGGLWADEDFCMIRSKIVLDNDEGQYANFEISVTRNEIDDGFGVDWDLGDKSAASVFFLQGMLDRFVLNRIKTVTIGSETYTDVLEHLFDPLVWCKNPEDPGCVEVGDVVGHEYSLTRGLISFQVHRGLQEPNEVFTIVP